jgi:uncharacterized membrane protein YqiK
MYSFYKKAAPNLAMVRTGQGGIKVEVNGGMWVIPPLHKMELMDLSIKTIEISRMHGQGLICADNIRADIKVVFLLRVSKIVQDIEKVAQTIGCERASDLETLHQLFEAKFSGALKTVGKGMEFEQMHSSLEELRDRILYTIGLDLNGYILEDCSISHFEQTHIKHLDKNNILDAEGIKKITQEQNNKYQPKH